MKLSVNAPCPCTSKEKYKKCCQVYHKGKLPQTALELMKSRYCAYAFSNTSYIIKTTHHENPDFVKDTAKWNKDILEFCKNTQFRKLEILEFIDGDSEAFVTFKAFLSSQNEDISFIEKSKFFKVDGKWLYHSGEFI